jgi:hypothetical protein
MEVHYDKEKVFLLDGMAACSAFGSTTLGHGSG